MPHCQGSVKLYQVIVYVVWMVLTFQFAVKPALFKCHSFILKAGHILKASCNWDNCEVCLNPIAFVNIDFSHSC